MSIKNPISHQQLKARYSHHKNFDAWIAFLRRKKILPQSVRKGNISSFERGNIGMHPGETPEFLDKIIALRKQKFSYEEIEEELSEDIKNIKFLYGADNVVLTDPRAKPDELIAAYKKVLGLLEDYYGWENDSHYSKFYRDVPDDLDEYATDYFARKMSINEEGDDADPADIKEAEKSERKMDACFAIIYSIIRQYEKLRKDGKVGDVGSMRKK